MDPITFFLVKSEMYCFFGIILGAVVSFFVVLVIEQTRKDGAQKDLESMKSLILQLFQEIRRSKSEEMDHVKRLTMDIMHEIRREMTDK